MNRIDIIKKANAYVVEIGADYRMNDSDDEVFFYKTCEEMEADLIHVIGRAHQVNVEIKAKREAKEAAKNS